MKLWKLTQHVHNDYVTYDSAVVAAETEQQARMIHPGRPASMYSEAWSGIEEGWSSWCNADQVDVEYIGEAVEGTEAGIICASYNAG